MPIDWNRRLAAARWKWVRGGGLSIGFAAVLHLLPGVVAADIDAQEVIRLETFAPCGECALSLSAGVRFGEAAGGGMIEAERTKVIYDPVSGTYGAFRPGATHVELFGSSGEFIRSIGIGGQGPGELMGILDAAFTADGHVAIFDSQRKWVVLAQDGALVSDNRTSVSRDAHFRMFSDDTVAVGAMVRRSDVVGYPLQLATLAGGPALAYFGSIDGRYNAADPYSRSVLMGATVTDRGVWHGKLGSLRVEEWTPDGTLRRVIVGEFDWFPEVLDARTPGSGEPPQVLLWKFAIDGRDRLWLVTQVADPGWRDVELAGSIEGPQLRYSDRSDYYDMRLDIFDLEARRHLGTHIFDQGFAFLVDLGGDVGASVVQYNERMVPRVVVYGRDQP